MKKEDQQEKLFLCENGIVKTIKMGYSAIRRGLGDDVAFVAKSIRLDKAAKSLANILGKEDCGCEKRKKKLNKIPSLFKSK